MSASKTTSSLSEKLSAYLADVQDAHASENVSFTAPKSLRAELSGSVFYDFVLASSIPEGAVPNHLAALVWKKTKDGSVRMVKAVSPISG